MSGFFTRPSICLKVEIWATVRRRRGLELKRYADDNRGRCEDSAVIVHGAGRLALAREFVFRCRDTKDDTLLLSRSLQASLSTAIVRICLPKQSVTRQSG